MSLFDPGDCGSDSSSQYSCQQNIEQQETLIITALQPVFNAIESQLQYQQTQLNTVAGAVKRNVGRTISGNEANLASILQQLITTVVSNVSEQEIRLSQLAQILSSFTPQNQGANNAASGQFPSGQGTAGPAGSTIINVPNQPGVSSTVTQGPATQPTNINITVSCEPSVPSNVNSTSNTQSNLTVQSQSVQQSAVSSTTVSTVSPQPAQTATLPAPIESPPSQQQIYNVVSSKINVLTPPSFVQPRPVEPIDAPRFAQPQPTDTPRPAGVEKPNGQIDQTSVPVDLDQPLAFRFAPDDSPWLPRAVHFYGDWLSRYMAADTLDDFARQRNP